MTSSNTPFSPSGFWQQQNLKIGSETLNLGVAGTPQQPTLLLLPGLGRDGGDFDALADILAPDFRLLRLDWRGSGLNAHLTPEARLGSYLEDCLAVLEKYCPDSPAWVLGATFGNRIARQFAACHPSHCTALVLMAAGGAVPPSAEATALARDFMERLLKDPRSISAELAGLYFGQPRFFGEDADGQANLGKFLNGWWPVCLAAQRTAARFFAQTFKGQPQTLPPTLVLQGLNDNLAPAENGRQLIAALSPPSRLVELPEAGHLLALEKPQAVAREIRLFKKKLQPE